MKERKSKQFRIFLYTISLIIIVFVIVDTIYFKIISETGFITLAIALLAMFSSGSKKPKKLNLRPKTRFSLITSAIILIVSGIFTAFLF